MTRDRYRAGPPETSRLAALRWPFATRARRRLLLGLLAVGVAAGLTIGGAVGWLMWRLADGPIMIAGLQEGIEQAVAAELGDVAVRVGGAVLDTDAEGDVVVRLADVAVNDLAGNPLIHAPQAVVGTRLVPAAFGSMAPTSIELVGPQVHVRRHADGTISLGFVQSGRAAPGLTATAGDGEAAPSMPASGQPDETIEARAFSPLGALEPRSDEGGLLTTLKQLVVRQARLTVYDAASQSVWNSFNATISIHRPGTALSVVVDAPFITESGEWRLRLGVEQVDTGEPFQASARFLSVVPAEIAAQTPSLAALSGLDMPVSGSVMATVSVEGTVESVDADLVIGAGFMREVPMFAGEVAPVLVDEGRVVASYSREKQRVDIDRFSVALGSTRINLSGSIAPERDAAGRLTAALFDLRAQDLRLAADDIARPAANIKRALTSGRLNFDPLTVEFDTLALALASGSITLGGSVALDEPHAIALQGSIEDLPADALVHLWPRQIAPGVRNWIAAHIPAGRVRGAQVAIDLGAADLDAIAAEQPLRDEAVAIDFSFDGVTARYLEAMPPIEAGSGSATLSGDRFVLNVNDGTVRARSGKPLAVTFGRFEVPTLSAAGDGYLDGNINLGTSGPVSAALEILDLRPLEFTRELGVDPARVKGDSTIILDLAMPLKNDLRYAQVQFQAGATLANLAAPDLFNTVALESDKLEIIATHQRIEATGEVRVNGIPASAKWDARIDEIGGRSDRLVLTGEVGVDDLLALGIDLTSLVAGTAPMTIEAEGRGSSLDTISLEADVSNAQVHLPAIGWEKPAGSEAALALTIERLDNTQVRLRDIRLEGADITVEGAIRLDPDGSLFKLDLDRLRLGTKTDFALSGIRRDNGVLAVSVRGQRFDAGSILEREIAGTGAAEPDSEASPVDIEFDLEEVAGAGAARLAGAKGVVRLRDGKVQTLRLRGNFQSKAPVQLDFAQGSGTAPAVVTVDTGDAGAFVRFLGLYARAHGGAMSVRARGQDAKRLTGVINARDFRIVDEPLLARIAATQSGLPPGAARNVEFTRLTLNFERVAGVLDIKDALIAGPAVGATLRGRVDIAGEELGLSGTYIPAYGLNAAWGAIPIVGPILSGRSGEGVFGMTFGVAGPMVNPRITINPMSTIAPGLMRRFFEFRQR